MEAKTNTYVWFNGDGAEINLDVKERVSFTELVAIAELTVSEVFKDGKYRPYMRDVILSSSLLETYAGIHFENADDMMEAMETTDLEGCFDLISPIQKEKLNKYIDEMIAKELAKNNIDRLCEYALVLARNGALLNAAEGIAQTMENHIAATPEIDK